jgi:hypothetical protein
MKDKNPIVIECVITIDSMENLFINVALSLKKIKIPAKIPNKGAVKKNLTGAEIGGA